MIELYFSPDPNPLKIVIYLEEAGLDYRIKPVNLLRGEQHSASFRQLNPNGKVPVLVDGANRVFDSNAILLYLAEKTGLFGSAGGERAEVLSWLMLVASGVGPFSGQAAHFTHFAPQPIPYALARYTFEANRHFDVLEHRLEQAQFLAGDSYTIADMAAWPWLKLLPFLLGEDAWQQRPNLHRFMMAIASRPAVQRALEVKLAYEVDDELDDQARAALFPHFELSSAS